MRRYMTSTGPTPDVIGRSSALIATLTGVLLILLGPNTATASHGTASGQSFTFLEPGFDQEIVGVFSDMNFMGGIAFAPDGDVWVNDCNTSTHLHRYDIRGVAPEVNGTKLHPESIVESDAGCGMTNHYFRAPGQQFWNRSRPTNR